MVHTAFANEFITPCRLVCKSVLYLPSLPSISSSFSLFLRHICPEKICVNLIFRAVYNSEVSALKV